MNKIHISTARKMLLAPEPLDITVLTASGELRTYRNAIGLKQGHYSGSRNIKLVGSPDNPGSGEIRKIRDCLILAVNGLEVFI